MIAADGLCNNVYLTLQPEPRDTDWIRVTSTDGFSFMVRRKVANISGTMRNMLDTESESFSWVPYHSPSHDCFCFVGNYAEAITRTCPVMQRYVVNFLSCYLYSWLQRHNCWEITRIHGIQSSLRNGWAKGGYTSKWIHGTLASWDRTGVVSAPHLVSSLLTFIDRLIQASCGGLSGR